MSKYPAVRIKRDYQGKWVGYEAKHRAASFPCERQARIWLYEKELVKAKKAYGCRFMD